MRKIGIIAAMKPEMEIIMNEIEGLESVKLCGLVFHEGLIEGHEVVLTECGVGKVNSAMAATLLISTFECDLIINTGIAGGVKPLNPRDVIIANKLVYHDVDVRIFGYPYGQVPGMPLSYTVDPNLIIKVRQVLNKLNIMHKVRDIYSGDQFVTGEDKLALVGSPKDCACEMEGCSIAHVCTKAGVNFLVIRFISDIIGEPSQIKDYESFETEMATMSACITHKLISNL